MILDIVLLSVPLNFLHDPAENEIEFWVKYHGEVNNNIHKCNKQTIFVTKGCNLGTHTFSANLFYNVTHRANCPHVHTRMMNVAATMQLFLSSSSTSQLNLNMFLPSLQY
jgi:hypothetical protein